MIPFLSVCKDNSCGKRHGARWLECNSTRNHTWFSFIVIYTTRLNWLSIRKRQFQHGLQAAIFQFHLGDFIIQHWRSDRSGNTISKRIVKKEKNHLCIKGVRWLTNKGTIICFSTPISVHVDNTFAENQIEMKETNKIKTEHNTVYYLLTYGSQMLRVDDNFSYSLVFIWTEKKR